MDEKDQGTRGPAGPAGNGVAGEGVPDPGRAGATGGQARAGGLLTDPGQAGLWEPFTYQDEPGAWLVAHWGLSPKLASNGWWFGWWWHGPGSRCWEGTHGGPPPAAAARFPSADAAAEALALDEIAQLAAFPCGRRAAFLAAARCPCGNRHAAACRDHVVVAHHVLAAACEHDQELSMAPAAHGEAAAGRCAASRAIHGGSGIIGAVK